MRDWLVKLGRFISVNFPFVIVFVASLKNPIDTDLGWHLKYGEYFFAHYKLLENNIFSTEMPAYRYINSAWGTDLLTYSVFHYFGFLGISLLGALVITLTFYFFSKAANLSLWEQALIFPLILNMEKGVILYSFRGQLLSLLGLSIMYFILSKFEQKRNKIILFTIPLFFIWVNVHGQFVLGLGLFTIWIISYLIRLFISKNQKKSFSFTKRSLLYITFIAVGAATLINPFGIKIYEEVIKHSSTPLLLTIEEWSPPSWHPLLWQHLILWTIFIGITSYILFLQKKFMNNIFHIMSIALLIVLSFDTRRYIWPMFFISIPLISELLRKLKPPNRYIYISITCIALITAYIYFGFVQFPKESILSMDWNKYCSYIRCSPRSAEVLVKKKFKGNLFSEYGWGGWLIWNYPSIKPSIDGRMAFWEDDSGYNALAKYYLLESNLSDIHKSKYDIVYIPPDKPIFHRLLQLVKEKKWKIVYQDGFAFIFRRLPF